MLGPGIITSAADNDAGGITTYSFAGARFGYSMLWAILLITVVLVIVQEMGARMGTVTQKGLGELIREQCGVRWTLFALTVLLVANLATTVAEFAGIAAGMHIFGIAPFISVPLAAVGVWFLVVRGNYKTVERVFIGLAVLYLTYIISGVMAHPNWHNVLQETVRPSFPRGKELVEYSMILIAVVGTTITPWMQFFLQAAVVDKGADIKHYKYQKADVVVGSILTDVVSFFIIIAAAATIYSTHANVRLDSIEPQTLAKVLEPVAGVFAKYLFAIGLLAASLLAASVLPLSTAYTFTEAFGFEIGISRRLREAPAFYGIYTGAIVFGAAVALIPGIRPLEVMVMSQVVSGVLLPIILIFMLRIINDKNIMGEYTNSKTYNVVVWLTALGLIAFSLISAVAALLS